MIFQLEFYREFSDGSLEELDFGYGCGGGGGIVYGTCVSGKYIFIEWKNGYSAGFFPLLEVGYPLGEIQRDRDTNQVY